MFYVSNHPMRVNIKAHNNLFFFQEFLFVAKMMIIHKIMLRK